jgi:hypothetical protein
MTYSFNQAFTTLESGIQALLPQPLSSGAQSAISNVITQNANATQKDVFQALYNDVNTNGSYGVTHTDLYLYVLAEISQVNGSNKLEPKSGVDKVIFFRDATEKSV